MEKRYSRRAFLLKNIVGSSVLLSGSWLLASCKTTETTKRNPVEAMTQDTPADQNTPNPTSPNNQAATKPVGSETNPCDDLTGVAPGELEKRKKFAYVNVSPIPDSKCGNCKLYIPAGKDKPCGACMLFKGPVRASGYCAYWAPIEE